MSRLSQQNLIDAVSNARDKEDKKKYQLLDRITENLQKALEG